MQISIEKSEIKGRTRAPSSKSYTIRGLMCAALARGQSDLYYALESDDTATSIRVLGQIGVHFNSRQATLRVDGDHFQTPKGELFCGDSAATLRFMSAICALVPGRSRLTAGDSLITRPIKTLVEALNHWGIDIISQGESAPIVVTGGAFKGGITELPGDISSQYVSALLLIAPLAEKKATIWLTTPLESKPYVLMTIECLEQFGVKVKYSDDLREYEVSHQSYHSNGYTIEGDWSSASYLIGLGSIAGEVKVENLNPRSWQGDKVILDLVKDMGALVETEGNLARIKRGDLKAIKTNLTDAIDLLPTMAVLAALAEGDSEFTGIQRARLKESNRVKAIKDGLKATGIKVVEELDRLVIRGGKPVPAVIDSQNDHRIAMAFSLLGVAVGGITIEGAECVSKTYPGYWDTLRSIGVKLHEQ